MQNLLITSQKQFLWGIEEIRRAPLEDPHIKVIMKIKKPAFYFIALQEGALVLQRSFRKFEKASNTKSQKDICEVCSIIAFHESTKRHN